jgi:sulfite dehydrogenase (cytochrome) subunit B
MKKIVIIIMVVLAVTAGFVYAGSADSIHSIQLPNIRTELKPGEGKATVDVYCIMCHSLDYITMQPNFPLAQWTATVNKMIKTFGAPINDKDAKIIIEYLAAHYGTGQ